MVSLGDSDSAELRSLDFGCGEKAFDFEADKRELINENSTKGKPHNGIAYLKIRTKELNDAGERVMFMGTGFLCEIKDKLFLATTAHNVVNKTEKRNFETVEVFLGKHKAKQVARFTVDAKDFYVPEDYRAETDSYDFAFLPLREKLQKDKVTVFKLRFEDLSKFCQHLTVLPWKLCGYAGIDESFNGGKIGNQEYSSRTQYLTNIDSINVLETTQEFCIGHKV